MISIISGLPGSGKNVYATYLAKKHFKRENGFIRRFIRKNNHEDEYYNNVYSTYPILLKKFSKKSGKTPIFSNKITLYDLDNSYKFRENAAIFIDEVQAFYDSDEYKDFPKSIATFNQFHRHFGISDIYYISQHPARIIKKLRDISCQFIKIRNFFIIPIVNIAFLCLSNYYEFEDYGKWHRPAKELKNYDVDNHIKIFRVKDIFSSYDSTYLRVLNEDKPVYKNEEYSYLDLTEDEIKFIYRNHLE